MAGESQPHDLSDQIVLKAVHDKSGWRVVLHIHADGDCMTVEGHARYADEKTCHEHGHALIDMINVVIGLIKPEPIPKGSRN